MVETTNKAGIPEERIRVEFDGSGSPSHLVIPLVLKKGAHKDLKIELKPRAGVKLTNRIDPGDALRSSSSRSHAVRGGGSLFATATYQWSTAASEQCYDVVYLPDFSGLLFHLKHYTVDHDAVGIELAFPVATCEPPVNEESFVQGHLSVGGTTIETFSLARAVHPSAGKILVLGASGGRVFGESPLVHHPYAFGPFIQIATDKFTSLDALQSKLSAGYNGLHIFTPVIGENVILDEVSVRTKELMECLSGNTLDMLFIATCNSVRVVSMFRETDIGALIAATENLAVEYANRFELALYGALGQGRYLTEAYENAGLTPGLSFATFSGAYNPMFLELRRDFRFGEKEKAESIA